jgi:cysteine desulfurase
MIAVHMRIYLDHNATTPVDSLAAEAMMRSLQDLFGNASSVHYYGQQAKAAIDTARSAVATLIGAEPSEIIFTSGGTEADNFAIRGVAEAQEVTGRKHLITSGIEHEAVLNTFKMLARRGWNTTVLPLDSTGIVSPDRLREVITRDTALVSVMHANNEIGTIQPISELAAIAHAHGALFHTDAVQSVGKIPIVVRGNPPESALDADLLAMSAHKFYGPKGVGALWVKRGVRLAPFVAGGKQERNRRAGTENVPGIIGMGVAASQALQKMPTESVRLAALRDRLEDGILKSVPHTDVNGARQNRVPNTTNISFERIEAESLLIALDLEGVAVSTGSACSSGTLEPSHVLKAMNLPTHRAQNSIRFSLGASNTTEQIDHVISILPRIVTKLRSLSAVGSR